jgi:hypothetical protein
MVNDVEPSPVRLLPDHLRRAACGNDSSIISDQFPIGPKKGEIAMHHTEVVG